MTKLSFALFDRVITYRALLLASKHRRMKMKENDLKTGVEAKIFVSFSMKQCQSIQWHGDFDKTSFRTLDFGD